MNDLYFLQLNFIHISIFPFLNVMESFHYKNLIFPMLTVLPVLHQQVKFLCIFLSKIISENIKRVLNSVPTWNSIFCYRFLKVPFESVFICFAVLILVLFFPITINNVQQNTTWHQYLILPQYAFIVHTIHHNIYFKPGHLYIIKYISCT